MSKQFRHSCFQSHSSKTEEILTVRILRDVNSIQKKRKEKTNQNQKNPTRFCFSVHLLNMRPCICWFSTYWCNSQCQNGNAILSSPQNFLFCWLPKTQQPCQMEWKKATGVVQDLLHVCSMYVLSVCLSQTFMLKFSIARVLVVEKLRGSYSCHPLCAIAGRKGMRPPATGKRQGDFFRSSV